MHGIIEGCKTYYQVKSGDSCDSIYTAAETALSKFLSWDAGVDSNCSDLW